MDTNASLAAFVAVIGLAIMIYGFFQSRRNSSIEELIEEWDSAPGGTLDEYTASLSVPAYSRIFAPIAASISERASSLLPSNYLDNLRRRLVLAGLTRDINAEEFLTYQVIAVAAGAVAGLAVPTLISFEGARGVAVGLLTFALIAVLPKQRLDGARAARVEEIERELPDVLDLLAISVEAGVGLEGAFAVVTDRFDSELSREIGHTIKEMQLGLNRSQALQNLRARTEIPNLTSFILALIQADALGMPLTRILKTQAEEIRARRQAKVREQAAKLPVKLLFPLAAFILPALFVVILGPAALSISEAL